jgi:hypothetical protein
MELSVYVYMATPQDYISNFKEFTKGLPSSFLLMRMSLFLILL